MSKKEQIIKSAIRIFVTRGFENTSTEEITKEAHVAKGTLFYHFKTKDDLVNAAYMHIKQRLKENAYSNIGVESDLKSGLMKFWINYTNWALNNRQEYEFVNKFNRSAYITKLSRKEAQQMFEDLEQTINTEVKNGNLKKWSYALIGNVFSGIHQAFITEFSEKKRVNQKDIEKSFEVFWDAIKR